MNEPNTTNETVRLPLWKNALETMRKQGLDYGATYTAEFFEKELRTTRDTMGFGLAISEIRRELEQDGYYLSGRGQKGDSFVILAPAANQSVMASYGRAAVDALKRGVILGTNTRLDSLSANERRKHEALLEKLAVRLALVKHSGKVARQLGDESVAKLTGPNDGK